MYWLSPAGWLAACGRPQAGLGAPFAARGGEAALAAGLDRDPRRLVMLVGPAGSGTSRLALELARSSPLALYPDPRPPPGRSARLAELTEQLRAGGDGRPVVVVDGPVREEGHALLADLLSEPLHPRLLVLVPCTLADAQALVRQIGYPRTNVIMATVDRPAAPAPGFEPPAWAADALQPFALAPRRPLERVVDAERLAAEGLVAIAGDTAVCLLGDRWRRVIVSGVFAAAGGEQRLRQLVAGEPALAGPALASLIRLLDRVPEPLLRAVVDGPPAQLCALLESLPPWLVAREPVLRGLLAAAVQAALATGEPAGREALAEQLADLALEPELALAAIDAALAGSTEAERIRRLLVRRALRTRDRADQERARAACRAADDVDAEARLLAAMTAQMVDEEPLAAPALAADWLALEERRGGAAGRRIALAHLLSALAQLGRWQEAIPLAAQLVADHRATGNVRRMVFFLHRLATLRRATGDRRAAEAALREALAVEEAVGYRVGQADCHQGLGEIFRADGDPVSAITHLEAALAILAEEGRPTDGVRSALEWSRGVLPRAGEDAATPPPPPPPEPAPEDPPPPAELITLRRRP